MRYLERKSLIGALALCAICLSSPSARAQEPPEDSFEADAPPAKAPPAKTEIEGEAETDGEPGAETNEAEAAEELTPRVLHVPLASVVADTDRRVLANIQGAEKLVAVVLHYRREGDTAYHDVVFERAEGGGWAAVLPAAELSAGTIEYYIGSRMLGAAADVPETLHFASPSSPQSVAVVGDDEVRWRRQLLALHLGNRSRFQLHSEYADFGTRSLLDGSAKHDYFWRIEGDYTYRILGWVYQIRLGAGLIRGDTWQSGVDRNGMAGRLAINHSLGLNYGYAEMRFRMGRLVRFDLRATLGAGPTGFAGGAGGQILIGNDPGTHFAVGVDGVSSVGFRAWLRLSWNTIPRLPMSFTIETLDLPDNHDLAGRVYLGAGYRFNRYFAMNATLGYGTRDFRIGGVQAGLGATLEF